MTQQIPTPAGAAKLVAIGGGDFPPEVSRTIVDLAGGEKSRVVVCPLASEDPETGDIIAERRFRTPHNIRHVSVFDFTEPAQYASRPKATLIPSMRAYAETDEACRILDDADVFYFSGGDQRLILRSLIGTRFAERLLTKWRAGDLVIAGTSAGLQIQSELAFTGDFRSQDFNSDPDAQDNPCATIARGVVEIVPGFGLIRNVILDQHFLVRRRQNRLFCALLDHPGKIGIGVDEGTALVLAGASGSAVVPRVVGRSCAFYVDGRQQRTDSSDAGTVQAAHGFVCGVVWSGGTFPFALELG